MWVWSIVMNDSKQDFQEQQELNNYIRSVSKDFLRNSTVYDPDRRTMNALEYAKLRNLMD